MMDASKILMIKIFMVIMLMRLQLANFHLEENLLSNQREFICTVCLRTVAGQIN